MKNILSILFSVALFGIAVAEAHDTLAWPDGRRVKIVQPNEQLDLSAYKSGVRGRVLDRRFDTNAAMFLANEIYLSGTEFFLRASIAGLPLANDPVFSFLTNVEAYWYSRYNLMSLSARSRAGIGIIHGPYVDLVASDSNRLNRFGRGRGEMNFSNKDVMLSKVIDSFLTRTGMPQKFENAVPLMLEFRSADPHLPAPVNLARDYTGRATYQNDYENLWWNQDAMDIHVDMGAVGQAMIKKVLWAKFFLRRNHRDDDFPGELFLGNNAEDGLRGAILTTEVVSTLLMAKMALFARTDRKPSLLPLLRRKAVLTGIDPRGYDSAAGLRYLPHILYPTLIYMGDLPVRHYDFSISDAGSNLWDQASWLAAAVEFFDYANPRKRDNWNNVFGFQAPYDGSIMPQRFSLLAQGMANVIFDNIVAMHRRGDMLVSRWTPKAAARREVTLQDLSMAINAFKLFAEYMDLEAARQARARKMIVAVADFLISVAANDHYAAAYDVISRKATGETTSTAQAFAVKSLIDAWHATDDSRYLEAAKRAMSALVATYWDSDSWIYRNRQDNARVEYTPIDVAALLAAEREMALVNDNPDALLRFKRFFVQAVDVSGMMQSESTFTGENLDKIRAGESDSDHDGIPFLGHGDGPHGVAPVFAARVGFESRATKPAGSDAVIALPRPKGGQALYAANCQICHGVGGAGNEGPRLIDNPFVQKTGLGAVMATIANGRTGVGMPSWKNSLSEAEIRALAEYLHSLRAPVAKAGSSGVGQ